MDSPDTIPSNIALLFHIDEFDVKFAIENWPQKNISRDTAWNTYNTFMA